MCKLEIGIPLDRGHKMIMLMSETEQVDLPRVCLCTPQTWECKKACKCLKGEDVASLDVRLLMK